MNPPTLYLIRHGECISNYENIFIGCTQDPPLTKTGVQQAQRLAAFFQSQPISAVFSSPLLRARQTAAIIAERIGQSVIAASDLKEVDLGALDRKDINNSGFLSVYENMVDNWQAGYEDVCVLDGESLRDVQARLHGFLEEYIFIREWNQPVLVVGHAILWMAFIWKNCSNHPGAIRRGFMDKANFSVVEKKCGRFLLKEKNKSLS